MLPKKRIDIHFSIPVIQFPANIDWRTWLPSRGNVLFTILVIGLLFTTQNVWARNLASAANAYGPSATTVNYQGRLANKDGTPITQNDVLIKFGIYNAAEGGSLLWPAGGPETHQVDVVNGLFTVGLGSLTTGGIPTNLWTGDRYLEITIGDETLTPRELIRSVPVAGMALTVPDGAIGTKQIENNGITTDDILNGTLDRADLNFATSELYRPQIPVNTCSNLITNLKAAGFKHCIAIASGETMWYTNTTCTSNVTTDPNYWQKYDLWSMSDNYGSPQVFVKPPYPDSLPYMICTKNP